MSRTATLHGRASMLAALFLALPAVDVAAQEDFTWTADRPDGVAPAGVVADRVLPLGAFEFQASYRSYDHAGVRFGNQFLFVDEVLQFFDFAPFAMSTRSYSATLSYGATDDVTLVGRFGWIEKEREQLTQDDQIFTLSNEDLADPELLALWEILGQDEWRVHLQAGASIPLGSVEEESEVSGIRTGVLPYEMQTGTGVIGLLPGITAQAMNESGSVGLQVQGRAYVGENDRGWRPGNAVEANGWAAYRVSRFISVSSGLRATAWGAIEGFDTELVPQRDPGELPGSFAGERVDIPLGVNVRMAEGPLAGHRMSVEFLWNVHEELDGPWLASDDGFVLRWTAAF